MNHFSSASKNVNERPRNGVTPGLAIFGDAPAFANPLHVGRPNIGDRAKFMARIEQMLDRRWFTNHGPLLTEFERRIAAACGVRECVVTSNATVGLELAAAALGMTGSVIVPAFTFVAGPHALQRQGITPIFCEIDPATHNIDPARIEALIQPDTTGIMATHLWGRACDVDALAALATRHGLKLLFDAAHAFGSSHNGRMVGGFGDAEVFSFHATKAINSFEGGAIVTNNEALAARLRLLVNFGFSGPDQVDALGTNAKMNEACAAMGLTSLESAAEIFAHNRANHDRYRARLGQLVGVKLVHYDDVEASSRQYVVVEIGREQFGLSRDQLLAVLTAENVLARRYFFPGCHRMEPYRSLPQYRDLALPLTEALCDRVLCLPTGTAVTQADIDTVCEIISLASVSASAIAARLSS